MVPFETVDNSSLKSGSDKLKTLKAVFCKSSLEYSLETNLGVLLVLKCPGFTIYDCDFPKESLKFFSGLGYLSKVSKTELFIPVGN